MLMKNMIEVSWDAPWAVNTYLEEIKELIVRSNNRFSHIMREGNKLADYLANYALDNGYFEAQSFDQLEPQGRTIVNNDKWLCLYLRVRVRS